jgi:unsaturated rhamnogalacturonyl hydrolase
MMMKKIAFFLLILFVIEIQPQQNQNINNNEAAGKIIDSFIVLHPDTVAYKTEAKSYRWNYEQGLILDAIYQYWKLTGDQKYFDYIKKNIDYYILEDGTIKTYRMSDFNIDNVSSGRVLLYLYELTKDEKYRKAADTLREQLKHHPRTSEGGFWHKKIYPYQMWLDGLYMAEPFYTWYATTFNDPDAFDDIANQFLLTKKYLKDDKTGLYYHGWDESKEQKWADPVTGRSPNFWGRSIGWFMMAIVDVLDVFPQQHPARNELITILQDLSKSLLTYRDSKTNLWFQVLDKGDLEGNYIEASASTMFAYAFLKGANKGYLDYSFFSVGEESFSSILKHLVTKDENGFIYLNDVCSVSGLGGKPYRDGSYEYYISEPRRVNDFKGYGPFMLAAIELMKKSNTKKKTIGLDYYFNNEWKDGKQWHYTWEDKSNGGFYELGEIFKQYGAEITSVKTAPSPEALKGINVYIIVDPDTPAETENPNYIDEASRNSITEWVKNGGALLVMVNDSGNCEFKNMNLLMNNFGMQFNEVRHNLVTGKNFDMGKFDNLPEHPLFEGVNKIYMKEISSINLSENVEPVLSRGDDVYMAITKFGDGFVVAIGDPWLYNEYIDNRKLPKEFENYKAAVNLVKWLLDLAN